MTAAGLLLIALVASIAAGFFFSGSETAIISVNRYRLRGKQEHGDREAGRLLRFLEGTQRLLIMTLIGNNLANVLTVLVFNRLMNMTLPRPDELAFGLIQWSELFSLAILTPIVIVFTEILPKAAFRAHADAAVMRLRGVFTAMVWLMMPAIWLIEKIARLLLGSLAEARSRAARRLTRKDVIELVKPEERPEEAPKEGEEAPAPSLVAETKSKMRARVEQLFEVSDERDMVENILTLNHTMAGEIMTPLVNIVGVRQTQLTHESLRAVAIASGYSRFPIFRERIVHIIGFVDIYDVLRDGDVKKPVLEYLEEAHYVPETKRIDDLLQEFLEKRVKNAVVVDEWGGCSGWISREDIMEEIVGELQDELDEDVQWVRQTGDDTWEIEGRIEIEQLNNALGTTFTDADWETLAGLALSAFGRIPVEGDEVDIDERWRAKVLAMDGRRIARLRMQLTG